MAKWTEADDAAFLASSYGLAPDPWQHLVLTDWLGRRADGRWACSTCALAVPRQNGKNGVIEIVELYFMVALGLKVLHTAHEVKTARKAFVRLCSFFENERQYPELAEMVQEIRRTNGQEAVVLTNGGSCEFIARSKGSGRGFTVDVLVCDEAQELGEDALEALTPTTSAAPSGNPLTIFTGTPPSPLMDGEVWTRVRRGALDGSDKRIAWAEWSVTGKPDLDDRSLWAETNPALGIRLNVETLEAERSRFSDAGFARERLGMWASEESLAVIPLDVWDGLQIPDDEVPLDRPARFALAMSPERVISIAVAIPGDDVDFVDLAEMDRMDDSRAVIEWLVERCGRRIPVMIDSRDPAASLVNDLRSRGVKVNVTTERDMGRACGGLLDAVNEGRVAHVGQPAVRAGLAVASKRSVGRAGAWEFDSDGSIDIAPLRAVTLARFGLSFDKRRNGQSAKPRVVVM